MMKYFISTIITISITLLPSFALAEEPNIDTSELTGRTKLSCEAILCLSSSVRPGECSESLRYYFGISKRKWKDTLKARKNFLNICPTASSPGMPSLINAIADGAGFCDAASLNKNTITAYRVFSRSSGTWSNWQDGNPNNYPVCPKYDFRRRERERDRNTYYPSRCVEKKQVIDDRMPSRCLNYLNHEFTYFSPLQYVGSKYDGGKWVE